jgi:hypothetical protein
MSADSQGVVYREMAEQIASRVVAGTKTMASYWLEYDALNRVSKWHSSIGGPVTRTLITTKQRAG